MSDPHAAIGNFVASYAGAWSDGDVEAVADFIGLPQMLAGAHGTTFIEEDAALDRWIEARLAAWRTLGVARATAIVETVEDLPDDAARVTIRWRLADTSGAEVLGFVAVDTLACDEGEWYPVVTDIAGEEAAIAGRA